VRNLPTDFIAEKNKTANTAPWIWLFECRINADEALRVCQYTADVTWPSGGGGYLYHAYPITFDRFASSTDNELQGATITIPNADEQIVPYIRDNNGLIDKVLMVRLVHSSHLDETAVPEWRFEIADCVVDRQSITWQVGPLDVFARSVPYRRYNRDSCGHKYGVAWSDCPYDKAAPGSLPSCGRTWDDCVEHGDDQVRRGVQRTCPALWGGFKSIPLPKQ